MLHLPLQDAGIADFRIAEVAEEKEFGHARASLGLATCKAKRNGRLLEGSSYGDLVATALPREP